MKKALVVTALTGLLITGCEEELPQPVTLISPEDGTVFSSSPLTFIWTEGELTQTYVIRIVKDAFFTGEVIVEDTLDDTTYTLSQEDFEIALNADYVWSVALLGAQGGLTWREFRSFTLDKLMPILDLDTTYFPYGLNNQWVYERHVWGYEFTTYPDDPGRDWDYYDTVSISVNDSLFGINGWTFYLNSCFQDGNPRHYDGDTVNIVGNWLTVFGDYKIFLYPEETDTLGYEDGIEVIYKQDTLRLTKKTSDFEEPISFWNWRWTTSRIKGIGVIRQLYEDSYSGHGCGDEQNIEDSLLYFIKGQDTVWRKGSHEKD
ncbi:hypothetical protein GF359_01685 [candidate division WOR-3 bacterium]|uniref:Uncharacterized protein n=1 Tax=candidate division WOR-3 bacterium TaxID=2052148 RepID=A0A9D5K853_UNCW3|nr:hypothetical protein [candidate division WOR-3 bacterium]MBD3363905.1 hypothetical protein [candidate division WOR-3 bacterium]